jgi:hypothetical protein
MQRKHLFFTFCILAYLVVFYVRRNIDQDTGLKLDIDEVWPLARQLLDSELNRPHYQTAIGSKFMDKKSLRAVLFEVRRRFKHDKS